MLLNDKQIKELNPRQTGGSHPVDIDDMIRPFVPSQIRFQGERKVVSYGLSSVGYDIRLSNIFKIPDRYHDWDVLDPHNPDDSAIVYDHHEMDVYTLMPGHMVLGASVEYFTMPKNVCAICLGKSTYARLGLFVNVTPAENSWRGNLTMELSNIGHLPIRVYANEGIAQLMFFEVEEPETKYDSSRKYQGQTGVTTAKL